MDKNIKEYRFTVFTQDASYEGYEDIIFNDRTHRTDNKIRSWTWKLNHGQHAQGRARLAIESIFCRDKSVVYEENHLLYKETTAVADIEGIQMGLNFGTTQSLELYSIRCNQVNSSSIGDTRPKTEYSTSPIIYMGPLSFQNTNPKETFNFECSKDILNSELTIHIDDNFFMDRRNAAGDLETHHTKGLKVGMNVGLTFILYDIRDDEK